MVIFAGPRRALVFAALALLGSLYYAPVFGFPFVHDDVAFILQNPSIARWDNLLHVFRHPAIAFGNGAIVTPYYRPLLEVFYRLQFALFGAHAGGFHLFNVALHVVNAFLVFTLALRLGAGRWPAVFGAAVFLLHPVQTQAVACVSGISNLAVTFFILSAALAYLRGRWWIAAMAFAAALFTKESAIIVPLLLGWYEMTRDVPATVDRSRKGRWPGLAGAVVIAVVFLLWRRHLLPAGVEPLLGTAHELKLRLAAIPGTLLMYARLLVWPSGLHYYRSVDILRPWLAPSLGFLSLALFMAAGLLRAPRSLRRPVCFGVGWGVLALLPVLNIVPLINEYSFVQAAEHFLYLPLAGACAAAAVMLSRVTWKIDRRYGWVFGMGLLTCLGALTARQVLVWQSETVLFTRAAHFEPDLGRVQALLALAYAREGRFAEALAHDNNALRIMADHAARSGRSPAGDLYRHFIKSILEDRGEVFLGAGDLRRADQDFRASLAVRFLGPYPREARRIDSRSAVHLGLDAIIAGDHVRAGKFFKLAVRFDRSNREALLDLGIYYEQQGSRDAARVFFRRAVVLAPGPGPAWSHLKKLEYR